MEGTNKYLKMFACCFLVRGAARTTICDVQRKEIYIVSNVISDFILKAESESYTNLLNYYAELYDNGEQFVKEAINFLEQNELCFFCSQDERELFPKINSDWIDASFINNAIIDINEESSYNYEIFIDQLHDLGCNNLQIRVFSTNNKLIYNEILRHCISSNVLNVELILPYADITYIDSIFLQNNNLINSIVLHSCLAPDQKNTSLISEKINCIVSEEHIKDHTHCGVISPNYFTTNINFYLESLSFNTCLNKKISIDAHGHIKNCPSSNRSFGLIEEVTLKEVIVNSDFNLVWSINKDQIEVCKDCEFRRVCVDCRVFIINENDVYSKPKKCNYNPYTNEWL